VKTVVVSKIPRGNPCGFESRLGQYRAKIKEKCVVPLQNTEYRERTLAAFADQPFAQWLGLTEADAGEGWFEVRLTVRPEHAQHDGVVHGGVIATLADTCAAMAAHTLVNAQEQVLTVEFKINYLRAARAGTLRCRGTVLRQGRTLTVSEAEVYTDGLETSLLAAKAMATIAIVPER
jgi:uncharacterized protein (TIGR00369 family)